MSEVKEAKGIQNSENPVFGALSFADHEEIVFCYDKETGLKAIIAIHSSALGPALGGTRMWPYKSEMEALNDVLRLSRGMSYKAAITGLKLGGGKAVIIGDSKKDKSPDMFRRYAKFINTLNGRFITAEDVGTSTKDMAYMHEQTKFVTGLPENLGGSGDPSPVTAYGVYMGMKASAKEIWGSDSLAGKRIAIQGVGNVGENLVRLVSAEGAKVFVSDIHQDHLNEVAKKYNSEVVALDAIYDLDVDIYSPCAMGATLNTDHINRLKCAIVAGAANNQLANENEHSKMLVDKGILYAPDFLINAGGLINVYSELNGYNRDKSMEQASHIYEETRAIFKKAKEDKLPTYLAAQKIAEDRISQAKK